ncbi:hypothetical protein N0V90_012821 [Kalmusia sp. IMI 367209]|nr:hypothetical protein N0V90_012821 [Kalmusia sp. IMI 367209]
MRDLDNEPSDAATSSDVDRNLQILANIAHGYRGALPSSGLFHVFEDRLKQDVEKALNQQVTPIWLRESMSLSCSCFSFGIQERVYLHGPQSCSWIVRELMHFALVKKPLSIEKVKGILRPFNISDAQTEETIPNLLCCHTDPDNVLFHRANICDQKAAQVEPSFNDAVSHVEPSWFLPEVWCPRSDLVLVNARSRSMPKCDRRFRPASMGEVVSALAQQFDTRFWGPMGVKRRYETLREQVLSGRTSDLSEELATKIRQAIPKREDVGHDFLVKVYIKCGEVTTKEVDWAPYPELQQEGKNFSHTELRTCISHKPCFVPLHDIQGSTKYRFHHNLSKCFVW